MAILTHRKRISGVVGLVLMIGLGWIVWPFMTSPSEIEGFCKSLAAGTSIAQVQAQAAQRGYRISSLVEGRAFVHEPQSFGRYTCNLQFSSAGLVSSVYSFND